MPHQIPWTYNEVVLACDLVRANGWWELRRTDPRVVDLSELLQTTWQHPQEGRPSAFRSPGSVSRKTTDLFTALPHYAGKRTKGGRNDRIVLTQFLAAPDRMAARAASLRRTIGAGGVASTTTPPATHSAADAWASTPPVLTPPADTSTRSPDAPIASPLEDAWARRVVASAVFQQQMERAGRRAPSAEMVQKTLAVLLASGGRAPLHHVAGATGLPIAPLASSTATVFKGVLNVEGYPVLDVADGFFRLDRHLLAEQFGVPQLSA